MVGLKQLSIIAIAIALLGTSIHLGALTLAGPVDGNAEIHLWGQKVGEITNVASTLTTDPYEKDADVAFSYTIDWSVFCYSDTSYVESTMFDVRIWQRNPTTSAWTGTPSSPTTATTWTQYGIGSISASKTYTHTLTETNHNYLDLRAVVSFTFVLYTDGVKEATETVTGTVAEGRIDFIVPDPIPTTGDLVVKTGTSSTTYLSITGPNGYTQTDVPASTQKTFTSLKAGTYTITLVRLGYETHTVTANVVSGETTTTAAPAWVLVDQDPIVDGDPIDDGGFDEDDDSGGFVDGDEDLINDAEYSWTDAGIIVIAVGFIAGLLMFVFLPLPPNIKAFIASLIIIAALIAAHLINTGGF